jgi:hypothetical protein
VKPEILDALPVDHPDALHSRSDLRIFNRVMGNGRWLRQILPPRVRPGERVLEIGAGDGEQSLTLARQLPAFDGLDLWPRPAFWPAHARWYQTPLQDFTGWSDYSVFVANLVLHQFSADELRWLGVRLQEHSRLLVFSEPARLLRYQWGFRALCLVSGANYVSRHDGLVSIAAGFLGDELPALLGLNPAHWSWRRSLSVFGAYRLVAERRK